MKRGYKRKLLESKFIELNLIQQSTIGIQSGLISGFIVIIAYGLYTNLLKNTGNLLIAFLVSSIILYLFYYLSIKRPLNKIMKKINILCKK